MQRAATLRPPHLAGPQGAPQFKAPARAAQSYLTFLTRKRMSSGPMATGTLLLDPGFTLPRAAALSTARPSRRVVYSSTMS